METKRLVCVGPGVFVDPLVRADLARDAEGAERQWLLLDDKGLRMLGLGPTQMRTLDRLAHAGLIELYAISPRRKMLKLESWTAHLRRVAEDPEFWERPEMRRRWRLACMTV